MPLVGSLMFCGLLVNCCTTGTLKVKVCVVDAQNSTFQCVSDKDPKGSQIPFENDLHLLCTSPSEIEAFLKECKSHKILDITSCKYQGVSFLCNTPDGYAHNLTPTQADNFFCLSEKDKKRLQERCF